MEEKTKTKTKYFNSKIAMYLTIAWQIIKFIPDLFMGGEMELIIKKEK
jgi:hypothetical protein